MSLADLHPVEREIITRLLDEALRPKGARVTIFDGEEVAVEKSADRAVIDSWIGVTDETLLVLYQPRDRLNTLHIIGKVLLVHGNREDVISDYTVGLERLVESATMVWEQSN